jgi:type IV fimbrial biogenesis protein FimT
MNTYTQRGFTLWELMTAMVIIGVILGFGVPNFMEFQRNNAMAAAANELVTGLMAARAEAVKRQVPVTLCASPNPTAAAPTCSPSGAGANGGFIVWVDENGNVDANGSPILTDATDGNAVVDAGETMLLQREAPGGTINVYADNGYITYGPNGFPRDVAGLGAHVSRVLYCDDRGNRVAAGGLSSARTLNIERTGRGQVLRDVADINNALAAIPGSSCP